MIKLMSWIPLLTVSCLFSSCRTTVRDKSDVKGHFEESSEEEARKYFGRQTVPPEWAPSRAVIVSSNFMENLDGVGEVVIDKMLDTGIDHIYMVANGKFTDFSHKTFDSLKAKLGEKIAKVKLIPSVSKERVSPNNWARDWSPLGAKSRSGELRFLDLNYQADRRFEQTWGRSLEKALRVPRISVPVYLDGGNFMISGKGHCMITEAVIAPNDEGHVPGDMTFNISEISQWLKDLAGCKEVSVFPVFPYEDTGHIDIWAKFLDDQTVIVGEIQKAYFSFGYQPEGLAGVKEIAKFLDDRAAQIEKLGFKVIRIPMPAPVHLENYSYLAYTLPTYTNSLILNKTVFVPRYLKSIGAYEYMDAAFRIENEAKVKAIYESFGYKVEWVKTDDAVLSGGSIHCTTMQVPR